MLVFKGKSDLKLHLSNLYSTKTTIGFVPTMGALHNGHLALVKKSIQKTDFTVVSIFVNPTQFDNLEDLEKYPKTLDNDLQLLKSVGCNAVYIPDASDVYDGNITSENFDFDGIDNEMEGKFRTGHFDGVATVVTKLFDIVKPTVAFFGEKDFQQLQIIKKTVDKLKLPVKVVGCPIHREKDGLAMSSRNIRLSKEHRENASIIYKTLLEVKKNYHQNSIEDLELFVKKTFKNNLLFELEYFSIADENTLKTPNQKSETTKPRAFIAVFAGPVRLIDNISLHD